MKNIKILSVLFLIFFGIMCVTSCGSDGDDYLDNNTIITKSSVIGTWMCTDSEDTQAGVTVKDLLVGVQITLKDDNTFTSNGSTIGRGTWTLSGNEVTAYSNVGTFVLTASVSGNTMKWVGTASNGVKFRYTFRKL